MVAYSLIVVYEKGQGLVMLNAGLLQLQVKERQN